MAGRGARPAGPLCLVCRAASCWSRTGPLSAVCTRACVCMRLLVCMCVHPCACVHVHVHLCACVRTHLCSCAHTCVLVCVCMHASVCSCVHTSVLMCVHKFACSCAQVCVHLCVHACALCAPQGSGLHRPQLNGRRGDRHMQFASEGPAEGARAAVLGALPTVSSGSWGAGCG